MYFNAAFFSFSPLKWHPQSSASMRKCPRRFSCLRVPAINPESQCSKMWTDARTSHPDRSWLMRSASTHRNPLTQQTHTNESYDRPCGCVSPQRCRVSKKSLVKVSWNMDSNYALRLLYLPHLDKQEISFCGSTNVKRSQADLQFCLLQGCIRLAASRLFWLLWGFSCCFFLIFPPTPSCWLSCIIITLHWLNVQSQVASSIFSPPLPLVLR